MRVRANAQLMEVSFSVWLGVLLLMLVSDAGQRMSRRTIWDVMAARLLLTLVMVIGRMADWAAPRIAHPADPSTHEHVAAPLEGRGTPARMRRG